MYLYRFFTSIFCVFTDGRTHRSLHMYAGVVFFLLDGLLTPREKKLLLNYATYATTKGKDKVPPGCLSAEPVTGNVCKRMYDIQTAA